jgi:glucosamine kinase
MKLIADSGGTKTAWFLVHEGQAYPGPESSGINLNVVSPATAKASIGQSLLPILKDRPVEEIHFYGAGLGTASHQQTMQDILNSLFESAQVSVYHDLLGAARAACGDEAGTVCILGTGSNACRYDGQAITLQRGGHGWIFSDEGGGTDLGKQLLKAALDEELPADLLTAFQQYVGVGLIDLRTAIYRSERPNTALARLAPFLALHRTHTFVAGFLVRRFSTFLANTVLHWPAPHGPLHFVGGIAGTFQRELEEACATQQLQVGRLLASPGLALAQYHARTADPA